MAIFYVDKMTNFANFYFLLSFQQVSEKEYYHVGFQK